MPAAEALQFVGGIPKEWVLQALKEDYGYAFVRTFFTTIVQYGARWTGELMRFTM